MTLKNCEKAAERVYFLEVDHFSFSLYRKVCGTKKSGTSFVRAAIRIVASHASAVALECYALHSIGRAHTLPMVETLPVDMLPGTLPNKRDVLAESKYDSKYLAGTNYIIENAQPGNVNFNEIVAAKLCRL
jgi:hypothetical protein